MSPLNSPLTLGSISPLQLLRGIADMSLNWWRGAPLLASARALFLGATLWGIVTAPGNPRRGITISVIALLALFSIRRR